jgi:hypothetical protein
MPIKRCRMGNGEYGYKWGDHGKCYASREGAQRQAAAAHANSDTRKKEFIPDIEPSTEKLLALKGMGVTAKTHPKKRRNGYSN